jgi:N-dimethylarginine dimethylaminohydrolase
MPEFGVSSEIGELRRVMVHHPGRELELANLVPQEHSFRRKVDIKRFQNQHRMFTEALRENGVDVLDVGVLVQKDRFASKLILQCPNLVYTRDTATITDAGAILFRMGLASRRDETPIIRAAFDAAGVPIAHQTPENETLEGGSFILLEGRVAFAALTTRATQKAIEDLQNFLLTEQLVDQFIQINPPQGITHVDAMLAELPGKRVIYHTEALERHPATFWTRQEVWTGSLKEWFRDENYDILEITSQEQEDLACDLLTVNRDLIIHSTSNDRIVDEIRERGIDVIQIPADELRNGNGGVHCMTCPILRN